MTAIPDHRRAETTVPAGVMGSSPQAGAPSTIQDRTLETPRIAAVIVTWNRKEAVSAVIGAIARQTYLTRLIDVVVVDNASTDGTTEHLRRRWGPERVVENPTKRAHEPDFQKVGREGRGLVPNEAGLASLTIVRNHENHGGCGGFNTGFAYVDEFLSRPSGEGDLGYVWLVDDDVDLPPDALERLVTAGQSDPAIGLVGSRTVDFNDRQTTIETTVYLDRRTGRMTDEPPPHHRLAATHRAWITQVGAVRGGRGYAGLREVDVVSACSLLARWSAVRQVGFWDYRYFIYCDDADWCLRMARAGHRVVLNLDAVVYHTPWHHKLTPARAYYAQRNALWMLQKILPVRELRRVTWRWMLAAMRQSLVSGLHRRIFQADITRRSIADMMSGRWGKLADDGPPAEDLMGGLDRVGALRRGRVVAVMCPNEACLSWAEELRVRTGEWLAGQGRVGDVPRWVYFVRNDVPGAQDDPDDPGGPSGPVERAVYSTRWRSKFRRQAKWMVFAPRAVVVFDQACDFPLFRGAYDVHVDRRRPEVAQIDRSGPARIAGFLWRWVATAARGVVFRSRLTPRVSTTRYG